MTNVQDIQFAFACAVAGSILSMSAQTLPIAPVDPHYVGRAANALAAK